jgi:hypothetical protein
MKNVKKNESPVAAPQPNPEAEARAAAVVEADKNRAAVMTGVSMLDGFIRFAVEKACETGKSLRDFQLKLVELNPELAKLIQVTEEKIELATIEFAKVVNASDEKITTLVINGTFEILGKVVDKVDINALVIHAIKDSEATTKMYAATEAQRLETEKLNTKLELERVETEKVRRAGYEADAKMRKEEHEARMAEILGEKPKSSRIEKNG